MHFEVMELQFLWGHLRLWLVDDTFQMFHDVLLVVHCALIQAHAAMMDISPVVMGSGTWSTKDPKQDTQQGSSEQL